PTRVDAKYSSQPSALSIGSPSFRLLFTIGISFGGVKSAVALGRVAYHRLVAPSPVPAGRGELNTMMRSASDSAGSASVLPLLITATGADGPKFLSVAVRVASWICCTDPAGIGAT